MSYEHILFDVDDPVATITLNRPEALNAWTERMGRELHDAVRRATGDRSVVGIVITGAGRGFCAGADMNTLTDLSSGEPQSGVPYSHSSEDRDSGPREVSPGDDLSGTYTYLMSIPKPIIAAINGAVAGMAAPIVLACDLRFMAETAVFTTSFAQRGLVAEWGLAWLLPRLVGPGHALDLLFSARKVDGLEAARIGLVNRALPTDEVLPAAQEYVRELARTSSPASMATMKRQVYEQLHAGLGAAEKEAIDLMIESFSRPDFAEGVRSFVERRPPSFPRLPS